MNTQYYTGIHVLSEIEYQKPGIATFPLFKNLPLRAGFSWGKHASSMMYKNTDKETAQNLHTQFFEILNLPKKRTLIDPTLQKTNELLEVTDTLFGDEIEIITGSNILFTKSKDITLMAHPGDCPCAIIFVPSPQPMLGLLHLGRKQTDAQLAEKAIAYLKAQSINPATVFVAICPGIAKENYFIPKTKLVIDLPHAEQWNHHKDEKIIDNEDRIYLDLHGYIVEQFVSSGILPSHIELYDVDTYASAQKGESFSHRYATVTNKAEKDGRFLLAVSLS